MRTQRLWLRPRDVAEIAGSDDVGRAAPHRQIESGPDP